MGRTRYRTDREDWPPKHDLPLPNGKTMEVPPTIHKNHSFYWDTSLTYKRMCDISDWIGSLTLDQRQMLDEIISDRASEAHYESSEDA